MFFIFFLITALFSKVRFCALPNDIQSIKTTKQIDKYEETVSKVFNYKSADHLSDIYPFDVFILFNGKEIVGYAKYMKSKAYSRIHRKAYYMFSLYCFTITEKYKGYGYSKRLLEESVSYLKNRYSLKNNDILALHLSPLDPDMPIAAKIYYSYGFKKGVFIENDPKEISYKLDEVFKQSSDMLDIINGKCKGVGTGYYFLLYCFVKDFELNKKNNKIEVKDTLIMFEELKNRKKTLHH